MIHLAKALIVLGVVLFAGGIGLLILSQIPWLGRLPGDLFIKKGNFLFYFPVITCLILSLFLSLILRFFHHSS